MTSNGSAHAWSSSFEEEFTPGTFQRPSLLGSSMSGFPACPARNFSWAAKRAYEIGQGKRKPRAPSRKRARAVSKALRREEHVAASKAALSRQARRSARERRDTNRSPKAAAQRGAAMRIRTGIASEAARKAARTRNRRRTRR